MSALGKLQRLGACTFELSGNQQCLLLVCRVRGHSGKGCVDRIPPMCCQFKANGCCEKVVAAFCPPFPNGYVYRLDQISGKSDGSSGPFLQHRILQDAIIDIDHATDPCIRQMRRTVLPRMDSRALWVT